MAAPAEHTQEKINNSRASGGTSSQKRRPPKLRPPKLGKGPISEDKQQIRREQRENGDSERTESNSPQKTSDSVVQEQNQDSTNYDQPLEEAEPNPRPARHRQHRLVREASMPSSEPDNPGNPQTQTDETRVQQVLSSPSQNREVGQLGHTVPDADGTGVNQVTETTEVVKKEEDDDDDQLRLRLDLNLDVEIQLKAKIQGDVTLQLLVEFIHVSTVLDLEFLMYPWT
ncbi:hypothetical protein N7510_009301 [Penicillium lagena]|uniref:uncharacterized protein n=1 Tax=Penicillium lagena TaxID=94218 RepID=UPI002540F7C0|nr:uncharacterized protein N7510_009301 [Penicillium lagena]KAJ5606520.1 hypothetical protein N7510_009301 [Penicillium lagena]